MYHSRDCGYLTFHTAKNHTPIKMQSTFGDDSIPKSPFAGTATSPKIVAPTLRNADAAVKHGKAARGAVSLIATSLRFAQMPQNRVALCHERLPLDQCGRAAKLVSLAIDEMAFLREVVMKRSVD